MLKTLPDRSVDLVVLDPPYWKVVNEEWDYKWRTEHDYAEWCAEWMAEVARVTRLSGSVYLFGYVRNLVYLYSLAIDAGLVFRQQVVIDKGLRSLSGRATRGYRMFPNVTESVFFFIKDAKPSIREFLKERQSALSLTSKEINERLGAKSNGGGVWSLYTGKNILAQVPTAEMWEKLQDVLEFDWPYAEVAQTFNIEMGLTDVWDDIDFYAEKRIHPTQKPVQLIERIIRASSEPGMLVLDPFFGSGATGEAALNLDRHYIGIEKDADYVKKARMRLELVAQGKKRS